MLRHYLPNSPRQQREAGLNHAYRVSARYASSLGLHDRIIQYHIQFTQHSLLGLGRDIIVACS